VLCIRLNAKHQRKSIIVQKKKKDAEREPLLCAFFCLCQSGQLRERCRPHAEDDDFLLFQRLRTREVKKKKEEEEET
jgi:hypothetical protein